VTRRLAFVDAPAGCSGDMFLGALVDLGLPAARLQSWADGLALGDVEVRTERVRRGALAATRVTVCRDGKAIEGHADQHAHAHDAHEGHGHRTLAEVLSILGRLGDLDAPPLEAAKRAFLHLAEAEARVHGVPAGEVHFHEVGASDALVDVAGTCLGLHDLGIEEVRVSPLPWSRGVVRTAHGDMPLPAPATVLLLEGHPTVPSQEAYEQVTPTGAALVRALATGHAIPAGFVPRSTGLGAGAFDRSRLPNVLRIVVGEGPREAGPADAVLLETNLDDVTGQVAGRAVERALEDGALDAWCAPITMKKGRPGLLLSLLVRPADVGRLEALVFRETPTLGVRRRSVARTELPRRIEPVDTPWGTVRMKVRDGPGGCEATPEHDDCRRLADEHGVPLRRVIEAAAATWAAGRA
jgi:uncharacterized protein (TIGR00299 family) protein